MPELTEPKPKAPARVALEHDQTLACSGAWTVRGIAALPRRIESVLVPGAAAVAIDGRAVAAMDTAGAWRINQLRQRLEAAGKKVQLEAFRTEHVALIDLVADTRRDVAAASPRRETEIFYTRWISVFHDLVSFLAFTGETVVSFVWMIASPQHIRWKVIINEMFEAGYKAMPIVGLLSFLMGVVITYQGAVQLQLYGASIYVADLLGYSMLRELAPLLTAILISGRTGSAYTAQIGTMQVTEEVAALRTLGIPPMYILVLPKLIALIIVLPLLSVFADIMAIFGGMVMANLQLGISFNAFLNRIGEAIDYSTFMIGIGKAPVFAAIIAIVGCYQGFKVRGSAESVGRHTTISVVQAIFLVIVTDALFSILFSMLGI
ncbi:MAG: MlaE family lipid ABC transporter permease subunit [Gammaproteobacteria bacterium]|nr:MlaE family lipid ABC transporter permease subunit [Gammaproteobacteria bacterium]